MKIISYFDSDRQDHWLEEIGKSDWRAGTYLHRLLSKDEFYKTFGASSQLLLLTEGEELVSFCVYAEIDNIRPTELTPWVGFVCTFPESRGHRYAGRLLAEAERLTRQDGHRQLYLSSDHVGLYERYGFSFFARLTDTEGRLTGVYVKRFTDPKTDTAASEEAGTQTDICHTVGAGVLDGPCTVTAWKCGPSRTPAPTN